MQTPWKPFVCLCALLALSCPPVVRARTWRSANRRFTCEAEFVKFLNKDTVVLKRDDDDKELTIKISSLCYEDQRLLKKKWALTPKFKSDYDNDDDSSKSTAGKKYPIHIDRSYEVGQMCRVWGKIVVNIKVKGSYGNRLAGRFQLNGTYRFNGTVKMDALNQDGRVSEWSVAVKQLDFFSSQGKETLIKPGTTVKGVATAPGEATDYRAGGKKLSDQHGGILNAFAGASIGGGVFLDEFFNSKVPRRRNESWALDPNETYRRLKEIQPKGLERKPIPGKVSLVGVSRIRGTKLVLLRSSVRFPYVLGVEKIHGQTTKNTMVVAATQYRPVDPKGRYCRTQGKTVICYAEKVPKYGDKALVDIILTYNADIETYRSK